MAGLMEHAILAWSSRLGPRLKTPFTMDAAIVRHRSAYAFHLAESQAFLDGNKRTAVASALVFLPATAYMPAA